MYWSALRRSWRLANAFIAGISCLLGVWLQNGELVGGYGPLFACLSLFALVGAGNLHNDWVDREIDAINRPDRPLPSKMWSAKNAINSAGVLGLISWGFAALAGPLILGQIAIMTLVLILYNQFLKSTPLLGNLTVALLCAWAVVLCIPGDWNSLLILAAFAAGSLTLLREMTKDIQDLDGDEACLARSTAVVFGPLLTWDLVRIGSAILLITLPLPWQAGWTSSSFVLATVLLVAPALLWPLKKREPDHRTLAVASTLFKCAMLGGILSLVLEKMGQFP